MFFEGKIRKRVVVVVVWRLWMMCFFSRIWFTGKRQQRFESGDLFEGGSCNIIFIFAMPLNVGVS